MEGAWSRPTTGYTTGGDEDGGEIVHIGEENRDLSRTGRRQNVAKKKEPPLMNPPKEHNQIKLKRGVYHPPLYTGRYEGKFSESLTKWAPSVDHTLRLSDVRNQKLPGELYREELRRRKEVEQTEQEMEDFLDEIGHDSCQFNTTQIQRIWRGLLGRRRFKKFEEEMKNIVHQRAGKIQATKHFDNWEMVEAITIIDNVCGEYAPNEELLVMKAKIMYTMAGNDNYATTMEDCCKASEAAIAFATDNYDAHYIRACTLVSRGMLDDAFAELRDLINLYGPRSDACKLQGYLCPKLNPPKYDLSVQNFDYLIKEHPDDLNMYLHRACAQVGRQNWEGVVADLTTVLVYEPSNIECLKLRARAFCCQRNWQLAEKDYRKVLEIDPNDQTAYHMLFEEIKREIPQNPSHSGAGGDEDHM